MPKKTTGIPPLSRGEIKRAIASVNASMAVEGLKPSRNTVSLGRQYLEGKISAQDAIDQIKAKHHVNVGARDE